MAILVLSTIIHFWSVGHLSAVTALRQLDGEFEAVSASLRIPQWLCFFRVTLPLSLPVILDMALYLFVNAMTTVSAVVFLYTPETKPAAVAILGMDDAGAVAPAAAMAMCIVYCSLTVRLLHLAGAKLLKRRTQAWRH